MRVIVAVNKTNILLVSSICSKTPKDELKLITPGRLKLPDSSLEPKQKRVDIIDTVRVYKMLPSLKALSQKVRIKCG